MIMIIVNRDLARHERRPAMHCECEEKSEEKRLLATGANDALDQRLEQESSDY